MDESIKLVTELGRQVSVLMGRVEELEAITEQQASRIEELEAENQELKGLLKKTGWCQRYTPDGSGLN